MNLSTPNQAWKGHAKYLGKGKQILFKGYFWNGTFHLSLIYKAHVTWNYFWMLIISIKNEIAQILFRHVWADILQLPVSCTPFHLKLSCSFSYLYYAILENAILHRVKLFTIKMLQSLYINIQIFGLQYIHIATFQKLTMLSCIKMCESQCNSALELLSIAILGIWLIRSMAIA